MKFLNALKSILFIISIVFIFINWKFAIIIFLITTIVHVIPAGPEMLLKVLSGYLLIGGLIYLFADLRIGFFLIGAGFLVGKFLLWMRKSSEYYTKTRRINPD